MPQPGLFLAGPGWRSSRGGGEDPECVGSCQLPLRPRALLSTGRVLAFGRAPVEATGHSPRLHWEETPDSLDRQTAGRDGRECWTARPSVHEFLRISERTKILKSEQQKRNCGVEHELHRFKRLQIAIRKVGGYAGTNTDSWPELTRTMSLQKPPETVVLLRQCDHTDLARRLVAGPSVFVRHGNSVFGDELTLVRREIVDFTSDYSEELFGLRHQRYRVDWNAANRLPPSALKPHGALDRQL